MSPAQAPVPSAHPTLWIWLISLGPCKPPSLPQAGELSGGRPGSAGTRAPRCELGVPRLVAASLPPPFSPFGAPVTSPESLPKHLVFSPVTFKTVLQVSVLTACARRDLESEVQSHPGPALTCDALPRPAPL